MPEARAAMTAQTLCRLAATVRTVVWASFAAVATDLVLLELAGGPAIVSALVPAAPPQRASSAAGKDLTGLERVLAALEASNASLYRRAEERKQEVARLRRRGPESARFRAGGFGDGGSGGGFVGCPWSEPPERRTPAPRSDRRAGDSPLTDEEFGRQLTALRAEAKRLRTATRGLTLADRVPPGARREVNDVSARRVEAKFVDVPHVFRADGPDHQIGARVVVLRDSAPTGAVLEVVAFDGPLAVLRRTGPLDADDVRGGDFLVAEGAPPPRP